MKFNKHYLVCGLLGIIYTLLTILIPPEASTLTKYSLSPTQAKLLGLTVALPYIVIWFTAFYGYIQCSKYAALLGDTKDGIALRRISTGLTYLAVGLPVSAISSVLFNYAATLNPRLQPINTIFTNYLALTLVMIGFVYINKGASILRMTILKKNTTPIMFAAVLIFVVFCVVYIYVTLTNPARQFPTAQSARAAYYLPDFLIVTTIIIPYLLAWYWGFRAAYKIHSYQKNVQGIIYQNSLSFLSKGVAAVVVSLIFLRFFVSLSTVFSALTLKVLLLVIYGLLIVIAIGYTLIALGAKKMRKIEEV